MAIHKSVDEDSGKTIYCISSHRCWMPGCYDSERAAKYAFRFKDEDLRKLQDSVNPDGVITFEMLQALRKETKK